MGGFWRRAGGVGGVEEGWRLGLGRMGLSLLGVVSMPRDKKGGGEWEGYRLRLEMRVRSQVLAC